MCQQWINSHFNWLLLLWITNYRAIYVFHYSFDSRSNISQYQIIMKLKYNQTGSKCIKWKRAKFAGQWEELAIR